MLDRAPTMVVGSGSTLDGDRGSLELPEGLRVAYHQIRPADAGALQRFHHRMSTRSIYFRYFGAKPDLSDRMARYFAGVDGLDRFALVARDPEDPGLIIAVASFDREGNTSRAEYAAAVEDRWQGRGLGTALTHRLIGAALQRGVRVFTGIVLPENARMLNLLRDLGLPERLRLEGGVEFVEIELLPGTSAPADPRGRGERKWS